VKEKSLDFVDVQSNLSRNFAYRTNIGIEVFILSAILILVITLGTVGYQAVKAALANPMESLRYE
jgi:putative ABC transport system permease protein